jgi:hypothetical protein
MMKGVSLMNGENSVGIPFDCWNVSHKMDILFLTEIGTKIVFCSFCILSKLPLNKD